MKPSEQSARQVFEAVLSLTDPGESRTLIASKCAGDAERAGGFGAAYMAEPVQRKVGVKIVKTSMDTQEEIASFEAEQQALAFVDHPYVARVLDAEVTEADRQALTSLRAKADTGDAQAQFEFGLALFFGQFGVTTNHVEAWSARPLARGWSGSSGRRLQSFMPTREWQRPAVGNDPKILFLVLVRCGSRRCRN